MFLLIGIILLAACFDFINGFHDAANSIASVVTTRVLTPTQAVLWAAGFNFVAFFIAKFVIGEFGVADTVSKVVNQQDGMDILPIIFVGLLSSIIWNLITWWFAIPSSSSHTLIGSLAGAGLCAAGSSAVNLATVGKIAAFIVVAPIIGMIGGFIITILTLHVAKYFKPYQADKAFKYSQLLSSAGLSIFHGMNDSTKEIGVISCAIIAYTTKHGADSLPSWLSMTEFSTDQVHDWLALMCFSAIALGTMSGGWKIMKTMGNKITKLNRMEGFCAQTAGALTLFITNMLKIPVSTTHVISGSIMGVGTVKGVSAVHWGVSFKLITAWLITIPVSGTLAATLYALLSIVL